MRAANWHRIRQPRRGAFAATLATALLCTLELFDPSGGALQAQQQSDPPTVVGRLIGPDLEPAVGLEVQLIPVPGSYVRRLRELGETDAVPIVDRARSDADGRFELLAPRPGPYRLEILAVEPVTTPPTAVAPVYTDLLPLAEPTTLADIRLPDMHDLVVGARDDAGKPVEGALVVARATRWSHRERQAPQPEQIHIGRPLQRPERPQQPAWLHPIFGRAVARTDTAGLVRLSLPTPDANVFVIAPGFELRAGMVEGRGRFELRPDPGVTLRVTDPGRTPVPRALVRVAENAAIPLALTNEDGEATVGLNSGEAIPFQVETSDRSLGRTQPIELPIDGSARPEVVHVSVAPAIELTGRAVDAETRRGIDGAVVWLNGRPGDHARPDAGGGFTLRTRPNIERLQLAAAATDYRTRTMEVPRERVRGRNGLSIELKPATRITGTVTDPSGNPVAGAQLLVDRIDPRQAGTSLGGPGTSYRWRAAYGLDHQAVSGADGTFQLTGLERRVAHQVTVEANGYLRTSIHLPAGNRMATPEPLEIVLERGRRAWGTVVDDQGQPVQGTAVAFLPVSRTPRGGISLSVDSDLTATTDPEGVFEFPAVGAGSYQLEVDHAEFVSPEPTDLDIPAGEGEFLIGEVTLAPGVTIEGVVSDPERRPVADARITAYQIGPRSDGSRTATTDDAGRFRVGGLRDRLAELAVEADGFARSHLGSVRPATNDLIEIELDRGATLAGRVVDTRGSGVADVSVNLRTDFRRSVSPGTLRQYSGQYPTTQTDDAGRFRFDTVEAGTWIAAVFGGPTAGTAESDPIPLQTGDVREIELVLGSPGAQVEGVLTNHLGDPVQGAQITIIGNDVLAGRSASPMDSIRMSQTDSGGRFRIPGVRPGPSTITAGHGEYRDTAREITVEPGTNEVPLVLEPGLEITGSVRSADGRPIPLAALEAQAAPSPGYGQPSGSIPSLAWRIGTLGQPIETLTDSDGRYRLTGLNDGAYNLRAWADGYGGSGPGQAVRLDGASVAGVDIVLLPEATIEVRIGGADPFGLVVRAFQDDDHREAIRIADGRHRIDGLGPGDWTVYATEFDGRTVQQVVSLAAGDDASAELDFEEGLRLSGQITTAGEPVSGGTVMLFRTNTQTLGGGLDRQGRFEIGGLQPGAYLAWIAVADDTVYRRRLELQTNREIRFDLEPPATLTGLVVDARTGQPLADAFVSPIVDIGFPDPVPAGMVRSDTTGRFELRTAPGSLELLVGREGFSERRLSVELAPSEHRRGMVFELQPGASSQLPP